MLASSIYSLAKRGVKPGASSTLTPAKRVETNCGAVKAAWPVLFSGSMQRQVRGVTGS